MSDRENVVCKCVESNNGQPVKGCPYCKGSGYIGERLTIDEHVNDAKFLASLRKAYNVHLLLRQNPQLTMIYLSQFLGQCMANESIGRGVPIEAVNQVVNQNVVLGLVAHADELAKQDEAEKAAKQTHPDSLNTKH